MFATESLSDYDNPGTKWGAASIEADGGCVQQVTHVTHDSLYSDETNANIRLIVAAPDLLAACKVLALTEWTVEFLTAKDPRALHQLRQAIANAEADLTSGESSNGADDESKIVQSTEPNW